MWDSDDLKFSANEFSGEARLFPLPNVVMFPNVMQPLHIFEPRYIQMVEDALATDRLIATCLILPDWQQAAHAQPEIAGVACLGKIISCQQQEDGTYNILLLGVRRVQLLEEFTSEKMYRRAHVEILEDADFETDKKTGQEIQSVLLEAFQRLLPKLPQESESLEELFSKQLPLSMLTDIVSYTIDIDSCAKQKLLAENRVLKRAEIILRHMARITSPACLEPAARMEFPPRFSAN